MAFKLQEAKVKQRISEEKKTVELVERMKLIQVQEEEIARRKCELESKILRPADADKSKMQVLAEANHKRCVMEAEGSAAAVDMKGEAEAYALEIKAKAKAEEMEAKAEAWKDYHKAAKTALWLEAIPSVTAEVAAPLAQVGRITMVGDPDSGESLGPARITQEVMDIVEKIPLVATSMTGHKVRTVV